MNHCHDCNSDYATPGTCNCFAPGGKRATAPAPVWSPFYPWWPQPYWLPYRIGTVTITTTNEAPNGITWADMGTRSCNLAGCGGRCGICAPPA